MKIEMKNDAIQRTGGEKSKTHQIWRKKKLTISEYDIVASLREHEELGNHGR